MLTCAETQRRSSSCLRFSPWRCNTLRTKRLSSFTRSMQRRCTSKSNRSKFHSTSGTLGSTQSSLWWKWHMSKNRKTSTMILSRIQMAWSIHTSEKISKTRAPWALRRLMNQAHLESSTRLKTSWTSKPLTRRQKKSEKRKSDVRDRAYSAAKEAPDSDWSRTSNTRLWDPRTSTNSRSQFSQPNLRRSSCWASHSTWEETSSWVTTRAAVSRMGLFWVLARTQWPPSGTSLTSEHFQSNLKQTSGSSDQLAAPLNQLLSISLSRKP